MADTYFEDGTHHTTIVGDEAIPLTIDPSGTPSDGYITFSQAVGTKIDGLKLLWNSTTSISVLTGAAAAENGDYIDVASALVKSGLSLSNSTWYHVYVYLSSGSPAAEVVTTAPAAWKGTAYSKTGDTSRRYVGSIKTDGSGNVYNFKMIGNRVTYLMTINAAPFRILDAGTATSETTIDPTGVVPATAQTVFVKAANTASDTVAYFGNSEDSVAIPTAAGFIFVPLNTQAYIDIPLDASQQFTYAFSAAPNGPLYVDTSGYLFSK